MSFFWVLGDEELSKKADWRNWGQSCTKKVQPHIVHLDVSSLFG